MERLIKEQIEAIKSKEIDDSEQDEWQPIENTPFFSENVQVINCDTRDFHCGWSFEDKREKKPNLDKVSKYPLRFFMTTEEVVEILLDLRERTGGTKPTWRFLSFKDRNTTIGGGWEFKYLRFYKTEKGWYCQPREEMKIIKKGWLKMDIDKEMLNSH